MNTVAKDGLHTHRSMMNMMSWPLWPTHWCISEYGQAGEITQHDQ